MPIYSAPKRKGYAVIKARNWRRIRPTYHLFSLATLRTLRDIMYQELKHSINISERIKVKDEIARVEVALETHQQATT